MMGYTSIASQLFIFAIADPLAELEQKIDSPCLLNLELLNFAIADPPPGLANAVDSSCLLICDRTQTTLMDLIGDIGTYNVRAYRKQITFVTQPNTLRRSGAARLLGDNFRKLLASKIVQLLHL